MASTTTTQPVTVTMQHKRLAVKDDNGVERPALMLEHHPGVGTVIDWMRTGRREIVADDRVRVVTDAAEWDHACEFDVFVTCPRCGAAARVRPHNSAHCVQCFTTFRTAVGSA